MKKLIVLFFVLVIAACTSSTKTSSSGSTAKTNNYKRESNAMRPTFTIFHVSDTISELHFKIASKELLYMRPDAINFSSNVLISYKLVNNYESKDILDSGSVRLVDTNNEGLEKFLIGKMNFKAIFPKSYYLRVTVTDLNRNSSYKTTLTVDKASMLARQNFMVRSKKDEAPIFRNYLMLDEQVQIQYRMSSSMSLFVRYYNREFPLAAPPFSLTDPQPFQYKADSTFILQLSDKGTVDFTMNKDGFYHFLLDTTKREGLTLFHFNDAFPEVKTADAMITPLRYITSREEFTALMSSANKKADVEKFWLECTGNMERAKEVIRKFYTRVNDANVHFSSYLEGWKTDRGMIYLIYGSPNTIYRTANTENWIYGDASNINSLQFMFVRVDNPFSDNDFSLERSGNYRQQWYMAVDVWRQGRAYLQD